MRVIAGLAKGRRLQSPKGETTRPMQDRVREAIFSSMGAAVVEASVLDLYAGTGSMGLEALSRGATNVTFVERDRFALESLRANVAAVALGGRVVAQDVERFLRSCTSTFEIVFVDPPYPDDDGSVASVLQDVARVTADGGIVLVHRRVGSSCPQVESLGLVDDRRYGGAQLWRFEKETR